MKNKCYIDFEYNSTSEEKLNLVSCSLSLNSEPIRSFWLYKDKARQLELKEFITTLQKTHAFVCFNAVAEGHAFYSLDLWPPDFTFIDLQNEWKMFINHRHEFQFGKQLIKGSVKTTRYINKWHATEEDLKEIDQSKPDKNLAAMVFKLLKVRLDTEHKNKMRDIIISNDEEQILTHKKEIMEYCESDVLVLPKLWARCVEIYKEVPGQHTMKEIFLRGRTSLDVALMTAWGYPVHVEKMKTFSKNVSSILNDISKDINKQFPDLKLFEWNNKNQRFTMKQKPFRDWIESQGLGREWRKTDKDSLSLSLEAFEDHFPFRHEFPEGNLGAQVVRFLRAKQSMNGFMPKEKGETIFDSLGSDGRVRSWLNPYGAQSGRFQPKATSYIPLKASWMRSLIYPASGKLIVGLDYSSEEFLIAACWSEDKNMYEAYRSGDVYLYFGKLAGEIPWDGKKEDYKSQRDKFKSTTLGISYLMSAKGLSQKLTQDTGRDYSEDEAQGLINKFNEAYKEYAKELGNEQYFYYNQTHYSKLPDGWTMFGDNPNKRSVANFPVQGRGSVILRSAIRKAIDRGVKVILPLHDALYAEIENSESGLSQIDVLAECMREAFIECFDTDQSREFAKAIRLDGDLWGPSLTDGYFKTTQGLILKTQDTYIDERSASEYVKFSKYMEPNN